MQSYLIKLIGTYEENPELYKKLETHVGVKNSDKPPPICLHYGTEDFLLESNRKLHALLKEEGFEVEYLETEGGHDWPFSKGAAPGVIQLHWEYGLAD